MSYVHGGSQKGMTAATADALVEDPERRIQITANSYAVRGAAIGKEH